MTTLLIFALLASAGAFWWQRRKTRAMWAHLSGMVEAIAQGKRPASFILHGEEAIWRTGLALETIADERDSLAQAISQQGLNSEAILSSMSEGVMILDTSRKVRLVNLSCRELFDLTSSPLGKSILQVLRHTAVDPLVSEAMSRGETQHGELSLPLSGAQIEMSASPIRNAKGIDLGVAVIFRDVTRMRRLEEVRREFVANVSHELRTPLSIFQGYLEILMDQPDLSAEERDKILQILDRHSARLNLVVEDLLHLAKMEAKQEVFTLGPVAMEALLGEVEDDWRIPFARHKVRFELKVDPFLPPVLADAERIVQVMNNLLENALKYTPEQGCVIVSATPVPAASDEGPGEIEVQVRDSGSGIPPGDLPHIFERFYRADKARSRSLGGTGLGLSIVKHSIAAQGGSVWAQSEPGEGTTLFLRLPCAPSETDDGDTISERPRKDDPSGCREPQQG